MRKLKLMLALIVVMQPACNTLSSSATSSPIAESSAVPSAAPSPIASEVALIPSLTAEPTLVPPAFIAPESFGKAKILHDYWPVIRKELGLDEKVYFAMTLTDWALSPDGKYVAVAGCDAEVSDGSLNLGGYANCEYTSLEMGAAHAYLFILDANTEQVIGRPPENSQVLTISNLIFTHDSSKLLYSGFSSTATIPLQIWDIKTAEIESTFEEAGALDISPDDRWLALSFDKQTRIWDLTEKKFVADLSVIGWPGAFSTDGRKLLIYNYPYLTIYDTSTWQPLSDQPIMPTEVHQTFEVSPDLSLLAICSNSQDDKPIRIWDIAAGTRVQMVKTKFGKCGRIFFSPDNKYLWGFNDHGAGPVIWKIDGWKLFSDDFYQTPLLGSTDLFVNRIEPSQDGKVLLIGTFTRLALYGLPESTPPPEAERAPTANAPVAPPPARKLMQCNVVASGAVKLEAQLCQPDSRSLAGENRHELVMPIDLRGVDDAGNPTAGITIYVPFYLQKHLAPGKYPVMDDSERGSGVTAEFDYFNSAAYSIDSYYSYAETGEIVLTEVGSTISGSFKFGAHSLDGRSVNVEGSFENVPYTLVNIMP